MPKPQAGETRETFVARCVPFLMHEGKPQNQAVAECESLWSEHKMADTQTLLADIRSRSSRSGIVTADRYFREVEGCFDGGFCPIENAGAKSEGEWRKALSDAEQRLTYSNPRMRVLKKSITKADASEGILQFDCIVTTPRRDHDGDVLMTKGARLSKSAPLLWQHIAMSPIGKLVKQIKHTSDALQARFVIADTALGRDAATLVKLGALRISHGFEPTDWEAMDDEEGYLFKAFNIFEVSLVSLPSNEDAVVTALAGKSFDSPLMRGWQKSVTGCRCKGRVSVPETVLTDEAIETTKAADESGSAAGDAEPLSSARTPSFSGTEETSWADVSKTFEAFRAGYYKHSGAEHSGDMPSSVADCPAAMCNWMASKSLLGNAKASEFADLVFFPVVNPSTNKLNAGALRAVLSGRGSQANISAAALESARAKAKSLLESHFKSATFEEIEREYFAELAKRDADALRKAHRHVSLMLKASEEHEEAKEYGEVLAMFE